MGHVQPHATNQDARAADDLTTIVALSEHWSWRTVRAMIDRSRVDICWLAELEFSNDLLPTDFMVVWLTSVAMKKDHLRRPHYIIIPLMGPALTDDLARQCLGDRYEQATIDRTAQGQLPEAARQTIQRTLQLGTLGTGFAFALAARAQPLQRRFMIDYVSVILQPPS